MGATGSSEPKFGTLFGALETCVNYSKYSRTTDTSGASRDDGFIFNANSDSHSYGNPMYQHASGNDIHPYNISMLPLICY